MQGKSIEQIKIDMLQSPDSAQDILVNVKSLVYYLVFLIPLSIVLALLTISYSRMYLYEKVLNKLSSKKKLKKWIGETILVSIIVFIVGLLLALLRFILNLFIQFYSQTAATIYVQITNMLFLLIYVTIAFFIFDEFTKHHQCFKSVSYGFSRIKKEIKSLSIKFLILIIILVIFSIINFFLIQKLQFSSIYLTTSISSIILLSLISIARIYFLRFK
jgi:magnesium-transporting ATPase (P-type)